MPARPAGRCEVTIGAIAVSFVPDGWLTSSPTASYPGSPPSLWEASGHLLDGDGLLVMSLGTLLVRAAGVVALVDLGWGPGSQAIGQPSEGRPAGRVVGGAMLGNLAALGVAPEDVDVVLFSHLHRDHTGWVATDGTVTFPNATHYVSEAEWAHWSAPGRAGVGPAPTEAQLEALAGRVDFVGDGDRPVPGIDVMATPGHTPGHLSFVVSSGGERAVVLGDAVHCPVEILEPELAFVVDVDPALARRTRERLEQELSQPGTLAAAPHFPDLVFGRLLVGEGRPTWHFPAAQAVD